MLAFAVRYQRYKLPDGVDKDEDEDLVDIPTVDVKDRVVIATDKLEDVDLTELEDVDSTELDVLDLVDEVDRVVVDLIELLDLTEETVTGLDELFVELEAGEMTQALS
jgi:hypothetical protein